MPAPAAAEDALRRWRLFAWLAALSIVLNQLWWNGFEVPSAHFVVILAALAVLVRPDLIALVLLCFTLEVLDVARDMPGAGSHTVLIAVGLAGVLASAAGTALRTRRPPDGGELLIRVTPLLRGGVVILYLAAALSKLNPGFFDPRVSCGAVMSHTITWWDPTLLGRWIEWPGMYGTIAVEASLPLLLSLRRTRPAGLAIGVGFHTVLALAGNVPFTAVLFALYVAFLPAGALPRVRAHGAGRAWAPVLASLVTAWVVGAHLFTRDPATARTVIDDGARGLIVALALLALAVAWPRGARRRWPEPRLRWAAPVVLAGLALLVANAATPYLGLKTESSFTMFSNLQTEGGDWNSYVVPEAVRVFSPQRHLVTVVASNDPALLRRTRGGTRMVRFELERYLRLHPRAWARYAATPGGPARAASAATLQFAGDGLVDRVAKFRDVRAEHLRGC